MSIEYFIPMLAMKTDIEELRAKIYRESARSNDTRGHLPYEHGWSSVYRLFIKLIKIH